MRKSDSGYDPLQLVERFIVSIWYGTSRLTHAATMSMGSTPPRLWTKGAGYKGIMCLFARFDIRASERMQAEAYHGYFGRVPASRQVTPGVDLMVITCHTEEGGTAHGHVHVFGRTG